MVVFLIKAGYGSYEDLIKYPVDDFMSLYWYENFISEYQQEYRALNERSK